MQIFSQFFFLRYPFGQVDMTDSGSNLDNSADFVKKSESLLRGHNLRVTGPRMKVLRVLSQSDKAMTAHEIHGQISESGEKIDVVSVYRILTTFNSLGIIHHIGSVDGYVVCSLEEPHQHHSQHIVCSDCSKAIEVDLSDAAAEALLPSVQAKGFKGGTVRIEVVAKCDDCSGKESA